MPTINQLPLRSPVSPGDQIPIYSPNNGDARRTPISAVADLIVNGLDLPNTAVLLTGDQTVGGTKTFSNAIVGSITGNAGTVTNGVYTTGNQTIGGTKTFSSTIVGDISGNAGSVTNGVYTTGNQTIGGTKTFSSAIVGDVTGNAGTVTNGVYTTGNQTIGGTKTFSSTIVGDISGNAGTVTNGVYTTGNQTIGGTKTFSVNPILSAGTVNAILTLDGSKQISAVSGLTWDSATSNLSLNGVTVGRGPSNNAGNAVLGRNALAAHTGGTSNVAIGEEALSRVGVATANTAVGYRAGFGITYGSHNVFVGNETNSGSANSWNVVVGAQAAATIGGYNTIVGSQAAWGQAGSQNSLFGHYAGGGMSSTASNNTFLGIYSGSAVSTGTHNTILGSFDGNQNSLDIRTTSNNIVLSDGAGVPRAFYNATASTWDFRTGASPGTVRLTIGDSAVTVANVLSLAAGTALLPSLAATGDLDTGMWFPAANTVAWSTGGTERFRVSSTGMLIGTTTNTNSSALVANGTISETVSGTQWLVASQFDVGTAPNQIPLNQYLGTMAFQDSVDYLAVGGTGVFGAGTAAAPSLTTTGDLDTGIFFPAANTWAVATGASERMRITSGGNVGINEAAPDYRLDVNGTFGFTPGSSVTPVDNGDVVFEATNNTTLTVKLRGSDGVVRSGTITLA